MLSYCPLDELEVSARTPPRARLTQRKPQQASPSRENTECNYLVMFFILGVFMLVISDQLKK